MKLNSLEQLESVKSDVINVIKPKSLLDQQGLMVWLDRNTKQTKIRDMNINYIANLINYIHRSKADYWYGYNKSEWLKALNNWLRFRNKQLDAITEPIKQLKLMF